MHRLLDIHAHYTGNAVAAADQFAERWQAAGIEKAVLFALTANDGSHASLSEMSALAERFPDFVIPFGYLTPGHHDALKETREAIARGFKGLKLIFPAKPYDDDEYFPIYEMAAKAGMVCLFHTGIVLGTVRREDGLEYQRIWKVSSNCMRPVCLDRIARSFPEMTIIGAHLGGGAWHDEAIEMMRWNANVYFDISIGVFRYRRKHAPDGEDVRAIKPRLKELYETGQLDLNKVLFGSDALVGRAETNPHRVLDGLQFELDGIGATDAEKKAVRWGTAARLLGIA